MLDVRTLLFALVLDDVVLAAALWVAVPATVRRGVGRWSLSILLQAVSWAVFAVRGPDRQLASILVVNAGVCLSFALQLGAILVFYGKRDRAWWYVVAPVAGAALFGAVTGYPRWRMFFGGALYAPFMIGLAVLVWRLHRSALRLGMRLLSAGTVIGGVVMAIRALAAAVRPETYTNFAGGGVIPVASSLLAQAVTFLTCIGFMLMHRERQEEEIERMAMTDALTGAYNRRTLFELGEKELSRAKRNQSTLSVVIFDLDHFKRINDEHGHLAGDAVLKRFVEIVQSCLRASDVLTRYGGEEFCILLPGEPESAARAVAERIRATVESMPFRIDGQTVRVTSSAGVAALTNDATLSTLVARADEALYAAKREGRNRVVVAQAA